jgi:hypothetical protein
MPRKSAAELVREAEQQRCDLERVRRENKLRVDSRELARQNKLLLKQIEEVEARADFMCGLQTDRDRKFFDKLSAKSGGDSTAILCMSDWHCGESVDPSVVNGINSYDVPTAEARIVKVFQKSLNLLDRLRHFAEIKDVVLWLGGDLMTGFIHEDLRQSNTLAPVEEALFVTDQVCNGIDFLLDDPHIERILVPCNHGNHGRTTPEKLISTSHKNSYEWGIYHNIARHYRGNPRVVFKIENGIHNWVQVQGHWVRFHHGDHIRYAGGVGGITIPVEKKIAAWNKSRTAALDVFGHYHQFVDHWRWVCNGSVIGMNAYAMAIGAEPQPPSQTFIVMSQEYGKVMAIPVFCE